MTVVEEATLAPVHMYDVIEPGTYLDLDEEPCREWAGMVHPRHLWWSHEQHPDDPELWTPVDLVCPGAAGEDLPLDRYECCRHCGHSEGKFPAGHIDPCRGDSTCVGKTQLGEYRP